MRFLSSLRGARIWFPGYRFTSSAPAQTLRSSGAAGQNPKGAETSGSNVFDRCVLLDPERGWAHTLTRDDLARMLHEGRPVSDPNPMPMIRWRKR